MLSDNEPTKALLSNYKGTPIVVEPKRETVSDQIEPPKKSQVKQETSSSKAETKSKGKKGKKSKAQKNFTFVLKIFNLLLGTLLTAFGVYCYYSVNSTPQGNAYELIGYIMPGYLAFSGLIIVAIEMHIGFICRNMKFLYNYFGRGFFNIYVGIMPLTLLDEKENSKQSEIQKVGIYILVSLLLFIGLLYILAKICCCAKEGDKRKKQRQRRSQISSDSSDSDE